jgi:hypothetical protein
MSSPLTVANITTHNLPKISPEWPLVVHLICWFSDASTFMAQKCIPMKDFGGRHITVDEDKKNAYAEVCTVLCESSLQAMCDGMGWVVFKWNITESTFATLMRGCSKVKMASCAWLRVGAWRFLTDINLTILPPSSVAPEKMEAIGLDAWAKKALAKYTACWCANWPGAVCSGCQKTCANLWKGTNDDREKQFCGQCWWDYFVTSSRSSENEGRVKRARNA